MKIEGWLFAAGAGFYSLIALIYWLLAEEPVGTTALVLTAGLAFLIGFYILFTGSRIDPRPEDQVDAEVEDGAGDIGFFSPSSPWPLPVAAGASMVSLGLAVGWWLTYFGFIVLGLSVIGFVFEYYRGVHVE